MRARSTLAALAAALSTLAIAPAVRAAIAYAPCRPAGFQCGQLTVPIDRSGAVPGTLTLGIQRVMASSNPTRTAVVGIAGGPGQAALPVDTEFAGILSPALTTADLVLFDQRGTGSSSRLRCASLESGASSLVAAAASCAAQLGPARGFYRTADTVDDLEAIRVESGYDKLVLFGVSYGTKVAEDYAAKYPSHVAALVLDSVVPPEGADVFNVSTFHAIGRVLGALCANGACNGITRDVGGDLARLVARAGRAPIPGHITTPDGDHVFLHIGPSELMGILVAGDLNPTLRAEMPAATRSALQGDRRPLLRLLVRAAGLTGIPGASTAAPARALRRVGLQGPLDSADSDALFFATRCEESVFPWDRNAGPQQRAAQAVAAATAHPTADFAPFDYRVAIESEVIPDCLGWPNASPPPAPPTALPQVPTLVISGQADLRTPLEDGQSVAVRIPGAQLLTVPYVGHSVLSTDLSGCAANGLKAFFSGQPVSPCPAAATPFPPAPVAPTSLARVAGRTKASKTVNAVAATVTDVRRQFIGDAFAAGRTPPAGSHVLGLRSGRATATATGFRLDRVEYVPGVLVSGRVPRRGALATLVVRGRAAARGRLTFHAGGLVTGRLDGRRVAIHATARAATALLRGAWRAKLAPHPRLVRLGG
jgi:pimeloyl-ACP methyl ester carboxylesterase